MKKPLPLLVRDLRILTRLAIFLAVGSIPQRTAGWFSTREGASRV